MKNLFKNTLVIVSIVLVVSAFVFLFLRGFEKEDIANCEKYQRYAKEFSNFYLTEAQDEMCQSLRVVVNAPVIKLLYE